MEREWQLATADQHAATRDECPSCGTAEAIRFLGSQIASLASVTLNELFGSAHVDGPERKLLAFTDSVQDASHRAAFFSARTYRFNLRTLMSSSVREHDGSLPLDALGGEVLGAARERGLEVVYGVIPPDLEHHPQIARVGRTLELTRTAVAEVPLTGLEELAAAATR